MAREAILVLRANPRASNDVSKSWFCTFANPQDHGYEGEPHKIVDAVIQAWIENNPQRTCAVAYCISAEGLHHLHAVLEDTKAMRFSAVKKIFPSMHIEATKGSKEKAEDYIRKCPPFDETGEQVLYVGRHGEIKGRQGQRRDLEIIDELIHKQSLTPNEIFDISMLYRKHEKIIKETYYRKRFKETPTKRKVTVYWRVGESGSGKSHTEVKLTETHGEDNVYKAVQYETGFADRYSGEKILFMDEFRGKIQYAQLLAILDVYKSQIHARYANVLGLWTEVHITSVFPPEVIYEKMINNNQKIDTYEQLRRRISFMVYHWKEDGEYYTYEMPMSEYTNYDDLKRAAYDSVKAKVKIEPESAFEELPAGTPTPWDDEPLPKASLPKYEQPSLF
jgi:hypothetical protein